MNSVRRESRGGETVDYYNFLRDTTIVYYLVWSENIGEAKHDQLTELFKEFEFRCMRIEKILRENRPWKDKNENIDYVWNR